MTDVKKKQGFGLLTLALIFLINPNVNVFDLLPDFVAFFIIAKKLSYAADRAPFFAEAKDAFSKLAIVTLVKIPAFAAMRFIRLSNVGDNDVRSLFSITFAIIELLLIFSAIKNLFAAFSYLGERSENSALIVKFPLSRTGRRKMSVDSLKLFSYVFMAYKLAMTVIPEVLLLTKTVTQSAYVNTFNVARLYPYVLILALITTLVMGIFWEKRFKAYIRAFTADGKFTEALDSLINEQKREQIAIRTNVRTIKGALTAIAVCSILAFDLRLDNIGGMNVIPPFLFGLVMLFGISRLEKKKRMKILAVSALALYAITATLRYAKEISFSNTHSYVALVLDPLARESYSELMILFAVETVSFIFLSVTLAISLCSFVTKNTGIEPTDERYSVQDRHYHFRLKRGVIISSSLSSLLAISKLTSCILRFYSKNTLTYIESEVNSGGLSYIQSETGIVNESLLPWFGGVVALIGIMYIIHSFYFFRELKDEVEMKYINEL